MLRERAAQQPIRAPESSVVFVGVVQPHSNHTRHSVKVGFSAGTQELLLSLEKGMSESEKNASGLVLVKFPLGVACCSV